MTTTYHVDWLFTGIGRSFQEGVLSVEEGTITAIETWNGQQIDVDLGSSLLIPGLVNAHTHLDLGALRGRLAPPAHFTDWLKEVIRYRRQTNKHEWDEAIRVGVAESIRHGTVMLADISCNGNSYDVLEKTKMDFTVFLELLGLNQERADLALKMASDWLETERSVETAGLSPHAPYSVASDMLTWIATDFAARPIAMHIAETPEELQLLESHEGPLKSFLQELGVWHPEALVKNIDQLIDFLDGIESYLIHGNYLTRRQWRKLNSSSTVVYCPRTHAYFGHEPHPYLEMLADGVRVALGTDSLASNPDLSILNECRFLWKRDRALLDGPTLLQLATQSGKTFLSPQSPANFVVVPHSGDNPDPWELLWNSSVLPSAVYLQGKKQIFSEKFVTT